MLRFGPDTGPVVIAALPLFEEANRTRTFVVTMLRVLALRGVASILPDLPGTGDSLVDTHDATIAAMREAYAAVAMLVTDEQRPAFAFGIRSAALLDTRAPLAGRYHFAPQQGGQVLRELKRLYFGVSRTDFPSFPRRRESISGKFSATSSRSKTMDPRLRGDDDVSGSNATTTGDSRWIDAGGDAPIELAGNLISPHLLHELGNAATCGTDQGEPLRIARLASDAQPADTRFDAAPLWRRAEPGNDPALAALIADDIAAWVVTCAG